MRGIVTGVSRRELRKRLNRIVANRSHLERVVCGKRGLGFLRRRCDSLQLADPLVVAIIPKTPLLDVVVADVGFDQQGRHVGCRGVGVLSHCGRRRRRRCRRRIKEEAKKVRALRWVRCVGDRRRKFESK